jgi:hypothetical protein
MLAVVLLEGLDGLAQGFEDDVLDASGGAEFLRVPMQLQEELLSL